MKKQLLLLLAFTTVFAINAQVTLVKEINDIGASNSSPTNLTIFNGKIYFQADDSNGSNTPGGLDLGDELWVTDGTESGTTFVKDINTGIGNGAPFNLFIFNGNFYFTANDGTSSTLWTYNATSDTATKVDIMPNPITLEAPDRFAELDGLAYFTVGNQPGTGAEVTNKLVEWNGTDDAVRVADTGDGYELISTNMVAFNNKLFLYMYYSTDDATYGKELYTYDPATDTFTLIKDIDAGPGDSSISNFTVIGSELYFEAESALWKTDGTTVGTVAVTAAASLGGILNLFNWNGKLYFEGDAGSGDQLWKYDPTGDTLTNLSNLTGTNTNHDPSDYAVYDGYLYYRGEDANDTDGHLFRTNGTSIEQLDATIKDIDEIVVLNNVLYFEGDNYTTGNELYKLDPTTLAVGDNKLEIISVYPNPASDYLMVPNSLIGATYAIYDITGKSVKEGSIDSEKINLNLNSGIYMFKIETELSTVTKKIIVE